MEKLSLLDCRTTTKRHGERFVVKVYFSEIPTILKRDTKKFLRVRTCWCFVINSMSECHHFQQNENQPGIIANPAFETLVPC